MERKDLMPHNIKTHERGKTKSMRVFGPTLATICLINRRVRWFLLNIKAFNILYTRHVTDGEYAGYWITGSY